jgi:hypothetical protein
MKKIVIFFFVFLLASFALITPKPSFAQVVTPFCTGTPANCICPCPQGYTETKACISYPTCGGRCECTLTGIVTPSPASTPTPAEPFSPPTCGWCPPGDEEVCKKYPSIDTALGCIPTHPGAFLNTFLTILVFLGGGIAFLLMIIGSVFVLTSQGNPERVKRGKEVFVGALVGLLMIIFSTFLLELIGVDILGLLLR